MTDRDCVAFLEWSLPQLRMQWKGFRKVRGQVCKRIDRRLRQLGLRDSSAYKSLLNQSPTEWNVLDSLCRVTISRFFRDHELFRSLEREVFPGLSKAATARGETELRCWSIGCASGEEAYSLATLWDRKTGASFPSIKIAIFATDADRNMIERAQEGCYADTSLKNLPKEWTTIGFVREGDRTCIRDEERKKVTFLEQDVRANEPDGLFHLILCRNLVFTYFHSELQKEILARLHHKLHDEGVLIVGIHETLPRGASGFEAWPGCPGVYRKI